MYKGKDSLQIFKTLDPKEREIFLREKKNLNT